MKRYSSYDVTEHTRKEIHAFQNNENKVFTFCLYFE